MTITWYGNSCFGVDTKERGEETKSIVFFPQDKLSRSHAMEERAAIIVAPEGTAPGKGSEETKTFYIDGPGEYELSGFMINAIAIPSIGKFPAAVKVSSENLRLLWMPVLPIKPLNDKELDQIGEIDILLMPLNQEKGDKFSAPPAEDTVKMMNEIEPRLVIPFAREDKTMKVFLDEAGVKNVQPQDKLLVKAKDLPEETQIIQLKI